METKRKNSVQLNAEINSQQAMGLLTSIEAAGHLGQSHSHGTRACCQTVFLILASGTGSRSCLGPFACITGVDIAANTTSGHS